MLFDRQILGLETDHLVSLTEFKATGISADFALTKEAGVAFVAMQKAASQDGIDCQIYSGFRSFETQARIWQRKWDGLKPILNDAEESIDITTINDLNKMFAILRFSALPGASRHHWGTDIDVYDARKVTEQNHTLELVASEYKPHGICGELNAWLESNAEQFGFIRPYALDFGGIGVEPWHYSYAPISSKIIQDFPLASLHQCIMKSVLPGKQLILNNLDIIYNRYILNNVRKGKAV